MLFLKCVNEQYVLFFFFFFQAEDGIRDLTVTGVQTCALPISPGSGAAGSAGPVTSWCPGRRARRTRGVRDAESVAISFALLPPGGCAARSARGCRRKVARSEERRVGKVCTLARYSGLSNKHAR